ncbi:hypothetical protein LguiA_012866 [Lonicera macranthoides]
MSESSTLMISSSLPPPLSLVCIGAIIIIYTLICYLVINLVGQGEDTIGEFLRKVDSSSGLSHEELEKVPCFNLKIGEPSTCPICLDGYQDSELCRIFPACNHVFHVRCIDLWLVKRLTCPVCRAPFKVR